MLRTLLGAVAGLVLVAGLALADEPTEVKGEVKDYNPAKGELTVTAGDKEHKIKVDQDTRFVDQNGQQIDPDKQKEHVCQGAQVTVKQKGQGGQAVQVQVVTYKIKKKGEPQPPDNPPSKDKPTQKDRPTQDNPPSQKDKPNPSQDNPPSKDKPTQNQDNPPSQKGKPTQNQDNPPSQKDKPTQNQDNAPSQKGKPTPSQDEKR